MHRRGDFPNQEANYGECNPTAVSNSLQYLNKIYNLGMDANQMSIERMKRAVGFDPNGPGTPLDTWWSLKRDYMNNNGYKITTRKITDISQLGAEIDANQDVEIQESWKVWVPKDPNWKVPYDANNYDPNCPHDANWMLVRTGHASH